MIKGLVFDMDGLLFDTERIVQRSWSRASSQLGYPDAGEEIYHTLGFNRARRQVYFKGIYGQDFPYDRFQDIAAKAFMEIIEAEGLPVKPGVYDLLEFAEKHGLRIGLATSSSKDYAENNLKEAGIYKYFHGLVYGGMVKKSKPAPEIYEKACKAIGVKPFEAAALEDSPSGIASAYEAGLRPIMIPDLVQPDGETLAKVWQVKKTLTEVIPVLAEELAEI